MDKNIAAILRTDTKTVKVVFGDEPNTKRYTYVTHLAVYEGDLVVVEVRGDFKVVRVVQVDTDLDIEPNSDTRYKWLAGRIDQTAYLENEERNGDIERELSKAYRQSIRQQVAASVFAGIADDKKDRLQSLLAAAEETAE